MKWKHTDSYRASRAPVNALKSPQAAHPNDTQYLNNKSMHEQDIFLVLFWETIEDCIRNRFVQSEFELSP
jgi:hypothetical protein